MNSIATQLIIWCWKKFGFHLVCCTLHCVFIRVCVIFNITLLMCCSLVSSCSFNCNKIRHFQNDNNSFLRLFHFYRNKIEDICKNHIEDTNERKKFPNQCVNLWILLIISIVKCKIQQKREKSKTKEKIDIIELTKAKAKTQNNECFT